MFLPPSSSSHGVLRMRVFASGNGRRRLATKALVRRGRCCRPTIRDLDIGKVARVGPHGEDGMAMNTNFERVLEFAHLTDQDCRLKRIID
jgi:hypothetical protein